MSKIKKANKYWSEYSAPLCPMKPVPPEKNIIVEDGEEIKRVELNIGDKISLDELIPSTLKSSDIDVYFDTHSINGNGDFCISFVKRGTLIEHNPRYAEELEYYNKRLEQWKIDNAKRKEELKLWKAWVKQEKEARLQKQLERAEKLLKKHGKKL